MQIYNHEEEVWSNSEDIMNYPELRVDFDVDSICPDEGQYEDELNKLIDVKKMLSLLTSIYISSLKI